MRPRPLRCGSPRRGQYSHRLLISGRGQTRTVKTGYRFPDALVWSADAPDLMITAWPLRAEAKSASSASTPPQCRREHWLGDDR